MIQYAITGGNHGLFLKRDRHLAVSSPNGCPPGSEQPRSGDTGFLPFPPANSLHDQARRLALHGIDWIQLREKHLSAGELAALARQILGILGEVAAATGHQTRLLINSRADVAVATGAHGVHLTATPGSLTPAQVHLLYRSIGLPPPIVSRSCHTIPEIRIALAQRPDLILFSPIFGKCVHGVPVAPAVGLEALAAACAIAQPIPVLALGGITPANAPACLRAGAAGVAGVRFFQPEADPARA